MKRIFWREAIYYNDATNFETDYARNKVRLKVLPYVESEINEQASEHIARSASVLSEANSFIEIEAENLYKSCVQEGKDDLEIEIETFQKAHSILKKEVIRKVLFRVARKQKDIEMSHVMMILDLIEKRAGKKADLPYQVEAIRYYTKVIVRKKKKECKTLLEREVMIPGTITVPEQEVRLTCEMILVEHTNPEQLEKMYLDKKNDYTKWFDYDRIRNTVLARYRRTGDFFVCNKEGNKKKLKDFLINQKVPAEKRDSILLLADGNHIMWAIGYRISEYYKVNSKTKRVLKVKVDGGMKHD